MIGEILGGVSALASLFGSLKSARANRAIDSQLAKQRSELQTWYDKEYSQPYLDTEEARSTLQILRNQAGEQMKKVDQGNAIRGASDETRVATADKLNRGMANATTQLAGYGTRKKEYTNRLYQGLKQNLSQLELQNLQNKSQQWSNFMGNAANAGTGFAKLGSLWKKKPSAGIVSAYQQRGIF